MANRDIDYKELLSNIEEMISLLEFDAMRSAGKAKLNCGHLDSLYNLKERYEAKIKPASAPRKATTAKASK